MDRSMHAVTLLELWLEMAFLGHEICSVLSELFTWTLYGFLGSMVKFLHPAWQGEMYSMLFSPHTGLKVLLGHEQFALQDRKSLLGIK